MENQVTAVVTTLSSERDDMLRQMLNLKVIDEMTEERAANYLSQIRGYTKKVQDQRNTIVKPINEGLHRINDTFKQILAPVEMADRYLNQEMSQYRARLEEERKKEQERLQKLAEKRAKKNPGPIPEVIAPQVEEARKIIETDSGKLHYTIQRIWEVEDIEKVPEEYFMLDEAKIGKLVRAGIDSIPGIRIIEKKIPVVRNAY